MKTISVTSLGLSGSQWIQRLEKNGYKMSSFAKDVLNSPAYKPMKKGENIKVAFVSVKDMGKEYATTAEIKAYATAKGYDMPSPELALLIREAMTDEDIETLGVWYVAALHDPIADADGHPGVLCSDRSVGGRWVNASWDGPDGQWGAFGAFAFGVPASARDLDAEDPSGTQALALIREIEEKLAELKKLL